MMQSINVNYLSSPSCILSHMAKTAGDRLKEARTSAGMSQDSLAKAIGTSRVAVTLWENGTTKRIGSDYIFKIARTLGIDPQWLTTGKEGREGKVDDLARRIASLDDDGVDAVTSLIDLLAKKNK